MKWPVDNGRRLLEPVTFVFEIVLPMTRVVVDHPGAEQLVWLVPFYVSRGFPDWVLPDAFFI